MLRNVDMVFILIFIVGVAVFFAVVSSLNGSTIYWNTVGVSVSNDASGSVPAQVDIDYKLSVW